ncbi:MAG: hypothetical protein EWV75_04575 [Microcystis wesenbergii Mw_QC_S_20081001_S30D]|uniref:Uncharacterized protein n=1 Tax=Microcystis wesenbergii Mw_QC_S_20081001_S30D TaxID=2486245 RepID=A0A552JV81_9CHRO|nr:MAG: hypothetical protein EWV75_04575 [Microcystis wesenbergii Mw_QC_S_20081001_S30D]
MKEQFVKWLNRILIFDVFLVIAGFLWFAVAVIGESTGIPLGFKLFQRLWLPLFNPAIRAFPGDRVWGVGCGV